MVLLIDHFDSFVHNQARYLQRMGVATHVERCDGLSVQRVRELRPSAILLSPGPCTPSETGATPEIIRGFLGQIPMLGICLGHQTLAAVTGGQVVRAPQPCHGRASPIYHDQTLDFAGIPPAFRAARYHSLMVERATLPACWQPTATTEDGLLMGMRHANAITFGWQFHPESVLTEHGFELLANFFRLVAILPHAVPSTASEVAAATERFTGGREGDWRIPRSREGKSLSF